MRFYWPGLMILPITVGTFYLALIIANALIGFNIGLAFFIAYVLSAVFLQVICDRAYRWMKWK